MSYYLFFLFASGVHISVGTLDTPVRVVQFDVPMSDTVGSVLAKVTEKTGISLDEQMLTYAKEPMDDSKTLADYGLKNHRYYIIRLAKRGIKLAIISVLKLKVILRCCTFP